jgi:LysM repeat protein
MHIIRAILKVAAVLGIAFMTAFVIVAILYVLLDAHLSEEVGGVTSQAASGIPSNLSEPDTLATPEQGSQPAARTPESERSMPVSEPLITLPDPSASEPAPPIFTPNDANESPSRFTRDSTSEADASPHLAAGAAPKQTPLSAAPSAMSSDEATSEISPPSEPTGTRYYTVQTGDTLYSIARRVYGEGKYWRVIYDANKNLIQDPVQLKLTWKLELPPLEKVPAED